jgi:hypothetical protein
VHATAAATLISLRTSRGLRHAQPLIELAQQHDTALTAEITAAEISLDYAATNTPHSSCPS